MKPEMKEFQTLKELVDRDLSAANTCHWLVLRSHVLRSRCAGAACCFVFRVLTFNGRLN